MKSETSLCDRRSTVAYLSKLRQKCSSQYAIWVRAAAARNRTADATYKRVTYMHSKNRHKQRPWYKECLELEVCEVGMWEQQGCGVMSVCNDLSRWCASH